MCLDDSVGSESLDGAGGARSTEEVGHIELALRYGLV